MVKIRLSRIGRTNRPYLRLVAIDSRNARDGAYLDLLGSYDPIKHTVTQLHLDKIQEWVSKGAQISDSAKRIIKNYKRQQAQG